jgi:hypothetical protein
MNDGLLCKTRTEEEEEVEKLLQLIKRTKE